MNTQQKIIDDLLNSFTDIRYVALYQKGNLSSKQKDRITDNSSSDSDRYEELLVNPVLLTAARQRGNIDCGGLRFIIIGYGNFYQLIKEVNNGHISICLNKSADLTHIPEQILEFIKINYIEL